VGRKTNGGTPATSVLAAAGVPHEVHRYDHDPRADSYGLEAVAELGAELGVEAARVLKTLVALVDDRLVVGVVPVERRLDLKALARATGGSRGALADPAVVQRSTGYVLGGVSPIGQRRPLPTVVDASALEHPTVLVSAGRRGLEVELAPADLVEVTGATVAPIAQ
jgi:Cys-tRNA(Pro)/Cys-tRNA(Cys) deacylase